MFNSVYVKTVDDEGGGKGFNPIVVGLDHKGVRRFEIRERNNAT